MPNIREVQPQPLGIQPTEIGVEATAAAARRGGAFFNQAAQDVTSLGHTVGSAIKDVGEAALKYEDHREISAGSKDLAARISNLTDQWNNLPKDPNNPSIAAKFRETVLEPELENFASNFHTEAAQKWAEGRVATLRQHMFEKTAADMSTLAGQAAVVNHRQTENFLSNAAYNDPSSLKFSLETLKSATEATIDTSPNLTADARGKLKTELLESGAEKIVKAAAVGYIEKTGQVPAWASDPTYSKYINGVELRQFQKAADAQTRANLYYQKGAEAYAHQQDVRNADANLSKSWTNNVTFDDNGRPTINPQIFKDVMETEKRYPGAATERAKAIINWSQSQQKEKRETIVTDKKVQADLLSGLSRTENPTSDVDILSAAANDKLDPHATQVLLQLHKAMEETPLKGPIYHDTLQAVRGITGDSPQGHERFAKFVQNFVPEYIRQKKAGTLPPDALDLRNENSLISKSLQPFRPNAKEQMEERIMKNLGIGASLEDATSFLKGGAPTPSTAAPKTGEVREGYKFKGGNPALPASWEKVK